jgi:hypothetical protein
MSGISQQDAFDMLARRLEHARLEHPKFATGPWNAYFVVREELEELALAIANQGPARILDEALDVAATAMRLVMGEVEG